MAKKPKLAPINAWAEILAARRCSGTPSDAIGASSWRTALDDFSRWAHARVVNRFVASVTLGLLAFVAVALGDAIQKWRTPDGSLYFGDRPPKGSILVETYADTPAPPATVISSDLVASSQAAADGRDIIRRREIAREAERQADAARELRVAEIEASQIDGYASAPFWSIAGGIAPCRFSQACGHDLLFPQRHVPHDVRNHFFFADNRLFFRNQFFPRKPFFPGNQVFLNRHFFPKVSSRFRLAPAPLPARQMSARFGAQH